MALQANQIDNDEEGDIDPHDVNDIGELQIDNKDVDI